LMASKGRSPTTSTTRRRIVYDGSPARHVAGIQAISLGNVESHYRLRSLVCLALERDPNVTGPA
jgi:hypothetical protein